MVILLLLAISGAVLYLYHSGKKQQLTLRMLQLLHRTSNDKRAYKVYKNVLHEALKLLNIHIEESQKYDNHISYDFKYQSNLFTIYFPTQYKRTMVLEYPYIFQTSLDNLDTVRLVSNEANKLWSNARIIYTFSEKEEKCIYIYVMCYIPLMVLPHELRDALKEALENSFMIRQFFTEHITNLLKNKEEDMISDLEYSNFDLQQRTYWVNQTEAKHSCIEMGLQNESVIQSYDECKIGDWLKITDLLPKGSTLLRLTSEGDDGYNFVTECIEEIENYTMVEPIVHGIGRSETPTAQIGSICILYRRADEDKDKKHTLTLSLENAGVTNNVIFVRINYMLPEKTTNISNHFKKDNGYARVTGGSLMIGIDWKDGKSKQTEFDFMWKDAQDKAQEGKTDEWSPEQRLVHSLTNADLGYDMYWGKSFLRQQRYYEAALHLTRAYNRLNSIQMLLNKENLDTFEEVCHMIGFCYMEMRQYKIAYYYLRYLIDSNHTCYIEEFINCLIALNDCHIIHIVSHKRDEVKSQIDELEKNEKEVPIFLINFYNFLRRRYVYICIEQRFLNTAESDCLDMLNEEDNADFALNELTYIQQLRENGEKDCRPDENDDDDLYADS